MKPGINLASEPFRRDRPVVFGFAAASAVLAITLAVLLSMMFTGRGRMADTRASIDRLNRQLSALHSGEARLDAVLRQPGNAEVLERSVLLNELIERKAISWTKIFSDLEKVLPPDVRLIQIRMPQVTSENQVNLEMIVGAKAPEPVLGFVRKLEGSPQFGNAWVGTFQAPSQNDPLFKYRVSVMYAQKL
jgi:type IV pilus assembly protein PilN